MSANHLEQLIAEWHEYKGYFVRRNVQAGKLPGGGYECELDIVAFHPQERRLLHVEPSIDADSWAVREARYLRKFAAGRKYIPELFAGLDIPGEIEHLAVFLSGSNRDRKTLAGGKVVMVKEILREIATDMKRVAKAAIPEQFPNLRTIQFLCEYRKEIWP